MQHFVSFILIWSLVCISTLLNSLKSRSVRPGCIQQIMSALPHQTATQFQSEVEAKKPPLQTHLVLCGTTQGLLHVGCFIGSSGS